jgi:diadenosine tetraphosphatase ApaH/serine/threonine PP2A family protein phosphatase
VDARAHRSAVQGIHARAAIRPALGARRQAGAAGIRLAAQVNEYLFADKPARTFERIVAGADCDVLVFGHTHQPWVREYGGVLFVNCGSVGKPKDGDPRAAFALLEVDGERMVADIERVDYDAEPWPASWRTPGCPVSTRRSWY